MNARILALAFALVASPALAGDILTAPVGINNTSPTYPLEIGSIGALNSVNPQLVIRQEVTDANGSGNSHSFASNMKITRTGTIGHNSFDCFDVMDDKAGQSNHYDHVACFQARPVIQNSGTTGQFYGYHSAPQIKYGSVTDVYHYYANTAAPASGGSYTNQYGFYCGVMASASAKNECLRAYSPVWIQAKLDVRGTSGELARFSTTGATSLERYITIGAQDLTNEGFQLWYNGSSGNSGFRCIYGGCKVEIQSQGGVKVSGLQNAPSSSKALCLKDGEMFVSSSNVCP